MVPTQHAYFLFILLYDDYVVEGRDNTTPIILQLDDTYLSESDNIDTQRLSIKVNLRVVLTVFLPDMTVSQLRHNRPITDELLANLALTEVDFIHFTPLILQRLCNALLTKCDDVTRRLFETMAAIARLTIDRTPAGQWVVLKRVPALVTYDTYIPNSAQTLQLKVVRASPSQPA